MNYISGEKIQLEMDLFVSTPELLDINRNITSNHPKAYDINKINSYFNNPKFIYTSTGNIGILVTKLDFFINPIVLLTHNSDYNIIDNQIYRYICNHPKIIKWYAQNVMFKHSKLELVPIGFANEQYNHGKSKIIMNTLNNLNNIKKINDIYFYFTINTNYTKRYECYDKLKNYFLLSEKKTEEEYFDYLASFKFAICPEGNGIDTHRLWECFYFKVIPIVLNNTFINIVKDKYKLPMIILNDWSELIGMELNYQDFDNSILDFNLLKEEILNTK